MNKYILYVFTALLSISILTACGNQDEARNINQQAEDNYKPLTFEPNGKSYQEENENTRLMKRFDVEGNVRQYLPGENGEAGRYNFNAERFEFGQPTPDNEYNAQRKPRDNQQQQQQQQKQDQQQESMDQAPQTEENAKQKDTAQSSDFKAKVVDLTNKEREKKGLSKLKAYPELRNVAQKKSEDMVKNGYFSHNSPTYGSPFEMMQNFGIDYKTAAENIAAGQQTPEKVVEGWMNSAGHRKNILNKNVTHIGIGIERGGDMGIYWTQMFIQK
ncbi:CAP domain-containing protein [Pontibacillus yanchengensis]|nr:CAP domain-containing protein [Pontibacillus yanchengensis]